MEPKHQELSKLFQLLRSISTLADKVPQEITLLVDSTGVVKQGLVIMMKVQVVEQQTFAPEPHLPIALLLPVAVEAPVAGSVVTVEQLEELQV
jgi:hypothetical protein